MKTIKVSEVSKLVFDEVIDFHKEFWELFSVSFSWEGKDWTGELFANPDCPERDHAIDIDFCEIADL